MKKKKSVRKELIYTICGSVLGVFCSIWIATGAIVSEASAMTPKKAIHAPAPKKVVQIAWREDRNNSVSNKMHKRTFNN